MTSNRPLEDWGKLIGDMPTSTAILDRFLSRAEVIQITGKATDSRLWHVKDFSLMTEAGFFDNLLIHSPLLTKHLKR